MAIREWRIAYTDGSGVFRVATDEFDARTARRYDPDMFRVESRLVDDWVEDVTPYDWENMNSVGPTGRDAR